MRPDSSTTTALQELLANLDVKTSNARLVVRDRERLVDVRIEEGEVSREDFANADSTLVGLLLSDEAPLLKDAREPEVQDGVGLTDALQRLQETFTTLARRPVGFSETVRTALIWASADLGEQMLHPEFMGVRDEIRDQLRKLGSAL